MLTHDEVIHIRNVAVGPATVVFIGGFGAGDSWGSIEAPVAQYARMCWPRSLPYRHE